MKREYECMGEAWSAENLPLSVWYPFHCQDDEGCDWKRIQMYGVLVVVEDE